jgi:hypothetical protein
MSEWWDPARGVLRNHFPNAQLDGDILDVHSLPEADIVAGGFLRRL